MKSYSDLTPSKEEIASMIALAVVEAEQRLTAKYMNSLNHKAQNIDGNLHRVAIIAVAALLGAAVTMVYVLTR